ncbi:MAG: hypothetical protein ACTSRA_00055 [Promethearchaeota archaeon]|nr:MAG: hypothetical protein [Helarchaeota virus Nidhogg Meg22_1012]
MIMTLKQVEEVLEKTAIILANDAFWARKNNGEWVLICPREVVITTPSLLNEDDKSIAEIPELPEETG